MRSFQIFIIVIFLAVFVITAIGSWCNLKKISGLRTFQKLHFFFLLLNAGILVGFVLLYVYPFHPRNATNYPVYFVFNTLLFSLFLFNLPMSFALLLHKSFEKKHQTRIFPYSGFILATGFTAGMVFGSTIGNRQIKVENVILEFSNLPENFDNYHIVQLSDLHLGGMLNSEKKLNEIKNQLDRLKPNLILFTGDMVNNFAYETKNLVWTMAQITGIAESYSILGNHDYGDYTNWESSEKKQANFKGILQTQETMGFKMLNNEHVLLRTGNDSIFLVGVENWGHPPFPQYANMEKALSGVNPESFIILMTHDPAHWESQVSGKEDIELTLSGHTHGLQWGIKLAGIPFSLAYFTRKTWGGLYQTGNTVLYVNTGFGTVGMPWRLDMPAKITLFTLKRSEID